MEETIETSKNQKHYTAFRVSLLMIGICFLMNPDVHIIDVLPDEIGYLFILLSIRRLIDLSWRMKKAYGYFIKAAIVGCARYICYPLVIRFAEATIGRPAWYLSLAFVIELGMLYFAIRGFLDLCGGMDQLSYSKEGRVNRSELSTKLYGQSAVNKNMVFTVLFLSIKAFMTILPETAALGKSEFETVSRMYEYIHVLRILCMIPVLIIGIIWLIKTLKFWNLIRKDTLLHEALDDRYATEIIPNKGLFVHHAFQVSFALFIFGFIFNADMFIDGKNILPDLVMAIFLTLGLFISRKYIPEWKKGIIATCSYGILSAVSGVVQILFFKKYPMQDIDFLYYVEDGARVAVWSVRIASIIETIAFGFMLYVFFNCFKGIIREHTGVIVNDTISEEYRAQRNKAIQSELIKWIDPLLIVAVASSVFYSTLFFVMQTWDWFWMVSMATGIAFAIVVYYFINRVMSAVENKYMVD